LIGNDLVKSPKLLILVKLTVTKPGNVKLTNDKEDV